MVASKIGNTGSAGQRGRALMELNSRLVRKANKKVRRALSRKLKILANNRDPEAAATGLWLVGLTGVTAAIFAINSILTVTHADSAFMPLAPSLLIMSVSMAASACLLYFLNELFCEVGQILARAVENLDKASGDDGAIARYAAKLSSVGSERSIREYINDCPIRPFKDVIDSIFNEIPDPATPDGLQSILEEIGGDSLSSNDDDPRTMCLPWHEDLKAALKKGLEPSPESWPLVMYVLDNSLSVNADDLEPSMEDEFEEAYRKIVDVSDPSVYVPSKKTAPGGLASRKPADALRDAMAAAGQGEAYELDPHAMAMLEQLQTARERLDKISAEGQAVEAATCL